MIPHGSAVALGMVAANSLSQDRGLLDAKKAQRIELLVDQILPDYSNDLIEGAVVLEAIRKDKKQTGAQMTAVLLGSDHGMTVIHDMSESEVHDACRYVQKYLASRK